MIFRVTAVCVLVGVLSAYFVFRPTNRPMLESIVVAKHQGAAAVDAGSPGVAVDAEPYTKDPLQQVADSARQEVTRPPVKKVQDWIDSGEKEKQIAMEAKNLKRDFARFLATARFTPEQETKFLALVSERALLASDTVAGLKAGQFPTQESADEFIRSQDRQMVVELKAFLGPNYDAYDQASEKLPTQRQLRFYEFSVRRMGEPLTPTQFDRLTDAIWTHYKQEGVNIFYSPVFSKPLATEDLLREVSRRQRANAAAANDAGTFLSKQQIAILEDFQKNQLSYLASSSMSKTRAMSGK